MDLRGASVAVTGATGFLGRYIVDTLLERGARVIGVVRNPGRVPELAARGVDMRQADLAEPEALARGFAGAEAVVSNAALFSLRNARWDDHVRCNVEGTRNVLEAMAAAGVRRVVHVSSVAVYGFGHAGDVGEGHALLDERTWRLPWNVYPVSKAMSERSAWDLAQRHGLALTTVRPCTIYGAFDPNFTPLFARVVGAPVTLMPAWLTLCFVHAGDVAEAIARALERPAAAGNAYNVTGPPETAWDFAQAWREAGGRTAKLMLPIPVPFGMRYDATRARRDLDFVPRPLVAGLRETFAREAAAADAAPLAAAP
jgi:dihydroflavonol-4-reductase